MNAERANEFAEYHNSLLDDMTIVTSVNKKFIQHGYQLNEDIRTNDVDQFFADIKLLNFSNPNECAETVNRVVEEKTNHTIINLMQPQMFDDKTSIVFVNGIHLKSSKMHGFTRECTHRGQFFIDENESVPVDFMCFEEPYSRRYIKEFDYKALDDLDATAVGIKYMQSKYKFVIVLPNKRMGLAELEAKLKNRNHDLITFADIQYAHVNVTIPKFKFEFETELNGALQMVNSE